MDITSFMERALTAYPDDIVNEYWDWDNRQPATGVTGDTLAEFVVRNLHETFDPDKEDREQVLEAKLRMEQAIKDLEDMRDLFAHWLHELQ